MENVKQGAQKGTATTSFGAGRRESHDSSAFYKRFKSPVLSKDETVNNVENLGNGCMHGDARDMHHLPDNSVAFLALGISFSLDFISFILVSSDSLLFELLFFLN